MSKGKKDPKPKKDAFLIIRIEGSTKQKLVDLAKDNDLKVSEFLRQIIEEYFK